MRIESASGKQWQTVHSGSSYCSQSDLALTFGLGKDTVVNSVEVIWPGGTRQKFTGVQAGRAYVIDEAAGLKSGAGVQASGVPRCGRDRMFECRRFTLSTGFHGPSGTTPVLRATCSWTFAC